MSLEDVCKVDISVESASVTQAGFGVPLILGYHTKFAELTRYYTVLTGMVSDGFAVTDPEYLAASAAKSQDPSIVGWKVGRRTSAPAQIVNLTPAAASTKIYTLKVGRTSTKTYNFTSDETPLVKEIVEGLKALYDADPVSGVTCTEDDVKLILTGSSGVWFLYEVSDNSGNANGMGLWTVADVSADTGIATDLASCQLADPDWYGLILTHQNAAEIAAAAAWVEANKKMFVFSSADTICKTSSAADILTTVKTAAYARTAGMYHQKSHQFAGAGWIGNCFPDTPGSSDWVYKTLAGVDSSILTDSEKGYIVGKHGNFYENFAGINQTFWGNTAADSPIDVTILTDWTRARLQEGDIAIKAASRKVPFTDGGIGKIDSMIRGVLQQGVDNGGYATDPPFVVFVPKAMDVPEADRALRKLTGVRFSARFAAAVRITQMTGTLTT